MQDRNGAMENKGIPSVIMPLKYPRRSRGLFLKILKALIEDIQVDLLIKDQKDLSQKLAQKAKIARGPKKGHEILP